MGARRGVYGSPVASSSTTAQVRSSQNGWDSGRTLRMKQDSWKHICLSLPPHLIPQETCRRSWCSSPWSCTCAWGSGHWVAKGRGLGEFEEPGTCRWPKGPVGQCPRGSASRDSPFINPEGLVAAASFWPRTNFSQAGYPILAWKNMFRGTRVQLTRSIWYIWGGGWTSIKICHERQGHYIMIKGSMHQEGTTIMHRCVSNTVT